MGSNFPLENIFSEIYLFGAAELGPGRDRVDVNFDGVLGFNLLSKGGFIKVIETNIWNFPRLFFLSKTIKKDVILSIYYVQESNLGVVKLEFESFH